MNTQGLHKIEERMRRMRRAVETLQSPRDTQTAIEAWEDFLMAASSFYSILEQATKTDATERGWFARLKGVRRRDPLLRYIHHARNSEDHGCGKSTTASSTHVVLKSGASAKVVSDGRNWHIKEVSGDVRLPLDTFMLVAVRDDRFGDRFEPPSHHLGSELENPSAAHLASLALRYLESVLEEAKTMAIATE